MDDVIQIDADYDWDSILSLLHDSYAYMEGRIDPPSSLHRLTVQTISEFAANEQLLVIEHGAHPIACIFLTHKPDSIYLGKLAVASEFRGQGFARMLIEAASKVATLSNRRYLELQTRIELTENHAAFVRLGFAKTGEGNRPGFDRPTEITMQKRL